MVESEYGRRLEAFDVSESISLRRIATFSSFPYIQLVKGNQTPCEGIKDKNSADAKGSQSDITW